MPGQTGFYPWSRPSEGINSIPDFQWVFSGTLATNQNDLIPILARNYDVYIDKLEAYINTPTQGQSAIFTVLRNGVSIGTVPIAALASSGVATLTTPIFVPKNTPMAMQITQTGTIIIGVTATVYARIKRT